MRLIDADELLKLLAFDSWDIDEWECSQEGRQGGLLANRNAEKIVISMPTVNAIPVEWIKEWKEKIEDYLYYTDKEKTLCIEELEDMLGAWEEEKNAV